MKIIICIFSRIKTNIFSVYLPYKVMYKNLYKRLKNRFIGCTILLHHLHCRALRRENDAGLVPPRWPEKPYDRPLVQQASRRSQLPRRSRKISEIGDRLAQQRGRLRTEAHRWQIFVSSGDTRGSLWFYRLDCDPASSFSHRWFNCRLRARTRLSKYGNA